MFKKARRLSENRGRSEGKPFCGHFFDHLRRKACPMSEASAVGRACPMSGAQPMSEASALAEANALGRACPMSEASALGIVTHI